MRALAFALICTAPTALAAPVPKELKQSDLSKMVGLWEIVPANKSKWRFDADGKAAILSEGSPTTEGITFAIDPAANPKTFDWITTWGEWYGVYELKDDTLSIYVSPRNPDKGRNLQKNAGPGIEVYSFKRAGK